jgi:uncharacterized repeat protein (TIGR03803 family)
MNNLFRGFLYSFLLIPMAAAISAPAQNLNPPRMSDSTSLVSAALRAPVTSAKITFTRLASFTKNTGTQPYGSVAQYTDGNFYGTTVTGGPANYGTIFRITPSGTLTTLYNFCSQTNCTDGGMPWAGLILGSDGNMYGTTIYGGPTGGGEVYKINSTGQPTTVYSFCAQTDCSDGENPEAALLLGADGNFYGTTYDAGSHHYGTVFKLTPKGALTTLYSFCSLANCADGQNPASALIQGADGNFYGVTEYGGANNYGTVFKLTPKGSLKTLYSFCSQTGCSDGEYPVGPLAQDAVGNLYGTTSFGGASTYAGTIFKITPAGSFSTFYAFCLQTGCPDGELPFAGLIQATDGNFYGTTENGGKQSGGTAFEITPAGALTTLYDFCSRTNCTDGGNPRAPLIQATSGTFYGTTRFGGTDPAGCGGGGCGTVFSLSVGLVPFAQTVPTTAKVAAKVIILGNNLTGSTTVSFNGTPATFTVVSANQIKTSVPSGATTGFVTVTTPAGELTSNVVFTVSP